MYAESVVYCYQKKKVPTPKVDTSQSFVKCPYGHRPSVGRQRGLFFMLFLSSKELDEFFERKASNATIRLPKAHNKVNMPMKIEMISKAVI